MHSLDFMKPFETVEDLFEIVKRNSFRKCTISSQQVSEVSLVAKLEHHEEMSFLAERIVQLNNIRIVTLPQDTNFCVSQLVDFWLCQLFIRNNLDCIFLSFSQIVRLINLTPIALADNTFEHDSFLWKAPVREGSPISHHNTYLYIILAR